MTTLTLLTDFGTDDYYVAAVKGVLLRLAPGTVVVDVAHRLPAGDVEKAAWMLAATARWYAAGTVHLAVVDPGVGSARRILAARAGGSYFVAPDNGLLTPILDGAAASAPAAEERGVADAADADAQPVAVRTVTRDDLYLPGPGTTFHGRDRFAPVAAWLARGGDFDALGPACDDPVRLDREPPRAEGEPPRPDTAGAVLRGQVVHVDHFGNLVTDLPSAWLGTAPCIVEVEGHRAVDRADHYQQIPRGHAAVLPGSLGTLELSMDGDDLARRWGVERGARVTVRVAPHSPG